MEKRKKKGELDVSDLSFYGKVPPQASELEKAVLGAIMLEREVFDIVIEILSADCFYSEANQRIFRAMVRLANKSQPIDILTVCEELGKTEELELVGGAYYVTTCTNGVVSSANIRAHAQIVMDKYELRELVKIGGNITVRAFSGTEDSNAIIGYAEKQISLITNSSKPGFKHIASGIVSAISRIEQLRHSEQELTGVTSGFHAIDFLTCGWQAPDLVILAARPSVGKCNGRGTKVIMFDGSMKNVEDVLVGDQLMGDDSTPRNVLSICSGIDQLYRINQVSGFSYVVNEPHILSLMASRNQGLSKHGDIIDMPVLEYLSQTTKFKNNWKGYKVPIEFPRAETEIPPYLLGLWLGDGSLNKPDITKPDIEIHDYIKKYCEENGHLFRVKQYDNRCQAFVIKNGKPKRFVHILSEMGILKEKKIPENFLINDRESRLELLAGLLDTDGYLIPTGGYGIIQKSEPLIKQIKYLADTLGFRTRVSKKTGTIKERAFTGEYFNLYIWGDIWNIPLKIKRKIPQRKLRNRDPRISGITVEKIHVGEYFGFVLDGNHRYLLEDCTVTHNTALALNMAMAAAKSGCPAGFFSMEMSEQQLIFRLLSTESKIGLAKLNRGKIDESTMKTLYKSGVEQLSKSPIYIDDTPSLNIFELRAKARKMKKDHNIGIIFIDYLQLMSGVENSKASNRETEISKISRDLKGLAKELHIPIIALAQLSREVEKRNSKIPQLSDLRESGAIEQDADIVAFMYRKEYYGIAINDSGESLNGETEIKFAKHRSGATETIKLRAELSIQKFHDYEPDVPQLGFSGTKSQTWTPFKEEKDEDDESSRFLPTTQQ